VLQDDLPSHHHSLYHEDNMMAVGAGVGEFQVLLLDSTSSTRHECAESTINLRDLE
jgi:microcompartment protein CcmK/EutM